MTDSPETKPAWEIAWEEQYPGDARHMNSSNPQPFRMVRERWRFQHGYETGYDDGLKEAELRASRTPVEAGVVTRERFACAFCGKPATCFGSYEGRNSDFACDDCCGHGCEDGDCVAVEREGYSAEGRGAARTPPAEMGACLADMPFERDGEIVGADICRLPRGHQGQHQTQLLPRANACPPAERTYEAGWHDGHAARDTELRAEDTATQPPLPDDIANLRAALAEATKLREAVDAVEAVYQTPESDAHDVVAGYEQHVRALLRAEAKNG